MTIGHLKGFLRDFRLNDALLGLQRSGKTGTLTFRSGDIAKSIYFRNGDMIFASSNRDADWLVDMLLIKGRITQEQ